MKTLQIFKPGRHVAADGRAYEFSAADLQATATAYDPAKHEAPLVVGHPKTDDPAYGWAKALTFSDALEATPDQVDAAFAEMVGAGRFKKISASFYAPDAPSNPVPGVFYLRHIGFLGAQPPAVKGLKNASFADADKGVIDFMDYDDMTVAALFRNLREWFIAKFGTDEADKVLPGYSLDQLQTSAATETDDAALDTPAYNENTQGATMTPDQIKAKETELAAIAAAQTAKDAEFAERETRIAAQEATTRSAAAVAFCEGLVKDGKMLPVHRDGMVAFMAAIESVKSTVDFSEGDKKVSHPTGDWLRTYLSAQPKLVDFKEHGAGSAAAEEEANPQFAAEALSRRAVEFQEAERKAGREINIAQAVQHVAAAAK